MEILLPNREALELLHIAALVTGGKEGVHDEKLLRGAIERPLTFVGYRKTYDVDTVCAVLIDSIARYHGFNDGNKRTALITGIYTYRLNGIHFTATEKMNNDFDDLVMWVVTRKPSIEKIEIKLKNLRQNHEGTEAPLGDIMRIFISSLLKKRNH